MKSLKYLLLAVALVHLTTTGAHAAVDFDPSLDSNCERAFLNRLVFPPNAVPPSVKSLAAERRRRESLEAVARDIAEYMKPGFEMSELIRNDHSLYMRWTAVREKKEFLDALQAISETIYARYLEFYVPHVRQEVQIVLNYFAAQQSFGSENARNGQYKRVLKILLLYGNNVVFIEEMRKHPEANQAFEDWLVSDQEF